MKKLITLLAGGLFILALLTGCGANSQSGSQTQPKEIYISAAASLKTALTQLANSYEQEHKDVKLRFNYGASGDLAQQIQQGAPVDLFISAGKAEMDRLEQKNLLQPGTRLDLLSNQLVLIVGKDNNSVTSLQDLTKAGILKVAIGSPQSVPAGKYAQDSLTSLNLWSTLQPKLVYGKDVTQVLTYVETGNADAGLVYRSDAKLSKQVKVACAVPDSAHKPIVYPAAVIAASQQKSHAGDFLKYLQSSGAQEVFASYGFKTLGK